MARRTLILSRIRCHYRYVNVVSAFKWRDFIITCCRDLLTKRNALLVVQFHVCALV